MANPDKPNGFKLVGKLGGSVQNNGVQNYTIASGQAGSIFSGDPVQMLTGGTISVVNSATTVKILGIFRGCKYIDYRWKRETFTILPRRSNFNFDNCGLSRGLS